MPSSPTPAATRRRPAPWRGPRRTRARRKELRTIAEVCERVPAHAPRTFQEALQYYWFVHLGVITEYNTWDAFNPGRLDQHLLPFYRKGLADGSLTREGARELLEAFWIKFNNQPAPPKVGVTAEESGTYTDFALINLGGLRTDGTDGVNELSYLILDVIEEMRLLQPSSMIQLGAAAPDDFLARALRIVRTGYGQPSIFNSEAIVKELVRAGKSLEDARDGGSSGCVETGAFGKEAYLLTGYFNLPKVFEITLHGGIDPRTGKRIGLETGDPAKFRTFDELFEAYPEADPSLRGHQDPGEQRHREDVHGGAPGAVPFSPHQRLHREGQGLSRRRGPVQHELYPGRRDRHHHGYPVLDQDACL